MTDSVTTTPGTPATSSTPNASIGSITGAASSNKPIISVAGAKFIPNGHSISRTITETFHELQDATGYSWKLVSDSTVEFYWNEFKKHYRWNRNDEGIIKSTWKKVALTLYNRRMFTWRDEGINEGRGKPVCVPQDVWDSWKAYWSTLEWMERSHKARNNRCSEAGGPGSGISRHRGGSKSTVEHTLELAEKLDHQPNGWEVFKKMHEKEDGSFVDARSTKIAELKEDALATASSDSTDINLLYLEVVGGMKKRRVYGVGSQALLLYSNGNSFPSSHSMGEDASEQRIKMLEEELLHIKENQEVVLRERIEEEVQQRVEKEVSLLKQENEVQMRAMEDRMLQKVREATSLAMLIS